jgi:hypothetical protein
MPLVNFLSMVGDVLTTLFGKADIGFQLYSMMRSRAPFLTSLKRFGTRIRTSDLLLSMPLVNWLSAVGDDPAHALTSLMSVFSGIP